MKNYVYHYTGKLNQSFIMKDEQGTPVYEAVQEKFALIGESTFRFIDHINHTESVKKIGKTSTLSAHIMWFGGNIKSSFKVDGQPVWELINKNGYDFRFGMRGLATHYEVTSNGMEAGTITTAGVNAMKGTDSLGGNIPAQGIYRITCEEEDIPGFFMMCFAITRCDLALNQIK